MDNASSTPSITIIVPCYNEERTIGLLLLAIVQQTTPVQQLEVIIADGLSTDKTREVVRDFQDSHPELAIKVVENPRRIIPAALNIAIQHSRGEFIIRLDAHCVPFPDYIERCIQALRAGRGTNVGGVWDIRPFGTPGQPPTAIARSIAAAAAHPLGVGDARYRYASQAGVVDTVPFGAFYRSLIDQIGGFNEALETNEDYEFNVRVIRSGGIVWLDPSIRSIYYARANLKALARQYWRYGLWKARMLQKNPNTLKLRQALPPVFVSGFFLLCLLSLWIPWARWLLLLQVFSYLLALFLTAISIALAKKDFFMLIGLPISIATMHFAWGMGLIVGILTPVRKKKIQR